jgi:hypothetical protein
MMRFIYRVEVELERQEGKFASRIELGDQIREALEGADYGEWGTDDGGVYSSFFDVTEEFDLPRGQRAVVLTKKQINYLTKILSEDTNDTDRSIMLAMGTLTEEYV